MSELVYLALAFAISVVGSTIVWWRHRKPDALRSGMDDFSRGLDALAAKHKRG